MEESTTAVKKTTRARKTISTQTASTEQGLEPVNLPVTSQTQITQDFDGLVAKIVKSRQEFDNLQKEISQIKLDWMREKKEHEIELSQRNTQEELERKREKETYEYSTTLSRKRVEDEFQDKKLSWEKELAQKKQDLEDQKKELESLRKQVLGFDNEKEQAVRQAQTFLEKQLTERYENEQKLREQEVKAEKDLLNMRISTLESDNGRLVKEIETFKKSLDEASRQVKEIAIKVIESGQPKNQTPSVVDKTD